MGTFVAWMRAKRMASGSVGPRKSMKQRGVVMLEYLILAGAVFGAGYAGVVLFFGNIQTEFTTLAGSILTVQ